MQNIFCHIFSFRYFLNFNLIVIKAIYLGGFQMFATLLTHNYNDAITYSLLEPHVCICI